MHGNVYRTISCNSFTTIGMVSGIPFFTISFICVVESYRQRSFGDCPVYSACFSIARLPDPPGKISALPVMGAEENRSLRILRSMSPDSSRNAAWYGHCSLSSA